MSDKMRDDQRLSAVNRAVTRVVEIDTWNASQDIERLRDCVHKYISLLLEECDTVETLRNLKREDIDRLLDELKLQDTVRDGAYYPSVPRIMNPADPDLGR